jgi:hypothetical protein
MIRRGHQLAELFELRILSSGSPSSLGGCSGIGRHEPVMKKMEPPMNTDRKNSMQGVVYHAISGSAW